MVDIIIPSNNRGIFVFDRGFDDKKVIKELHQHDASYIIRMKSNRKVIFQNEWHNIAAIANKLTLNFEISSSPKKTITAGVVDIEVPINPHTLKNPVLVKTRLVVAKITSKTKSGQTKQGLFCLLVHLPQHHLFDTEFCEFALESYRLRWKIEEVPRQIKNDFKWEDIQLLNFHRLQAMNTLLWLAISFLYELDTWRIKLAKTFPNLMLDKKNALKKVLQKFIYYKLALVIKYCFNQVRLYRKLAGKWKKKTTCNCVRHFTKIFSGYAKEMNYIDKLSTVYTLLFLYQYALKK